MRNPQQDSELTDAMRRYDRLAQQLREVDAEITSLGVDIAKIDRPVLCTRVVAKHAVHFIPEDR